MKLNLIAAFGVMMFLATPTAYAAKPPTVAPEVQAAADRCTDDTRGILMGGQVVCAVTVSADGNNCDHEAGAILVLIQGKEICAKDPIVTELDGSPLATLMVDDDDEGSQQTVAPPSGGTPNCGNLEVGKLNGHVMCVGETKLICDKEDSRNDVPASAFNIVWDDELCVWNFELMN